MFAKTESEEIAAYFKIVMPFQVHIESKKPLPVIVQLQNVAGSPPIKLEALWPNNPAGFPVVRKRNRDYPFLGPGIRNPPVTGFPACPPTSKLARLAYYPIAFLVTD